MAGADPAEGAFAARLLLGEIQKIARDVDHAAVFVHHHHSAGAHHRAGPGQGVEIHRRIEKIGGQAASRRPADLHRLELFFIGNAAADIENQFPQGHPHGNLHQSRMGHVAHYGKNRRTRTVRCTDAPKPVGPLV